jgi:hypothetical protein
MTIPSRVFDCLPPPVFSSRYRITVDTEELPEFEGGEGIHIIAGVDPGYLNAGLMKPRRGFTLVAAGKNCGWASFRLYGTLDQSDLFSISFEKGMCPCFQAFLVITYMNQYFFRCFHEEIQVFFDIVDVIRSDQRKRPDTRCLIL